MTVELTKDDEERKFHGYQRPTEIFDALEFWGKISGSMLLEWGLTEEELIIIMSEQLDTKSFKQWEKRIERRK